MSYFAFLRRDIEQLLFRDRDPHTIPAMDGAFSPNDRLDAATPIGEPLEGADAAVEGPDGSLYVSAGKRVWRLEGEGFRERAPLASFDVKAGALALAPSGRLLVCTEDGLAVLDEQGRATQWLREAGGERLRCLTAVACAPDGSVFLADGAAGHKAEDWRVDLMEDNRTGRLIGCGPSLEGASVLMRDLAYPAGLAQAGGFLWFTESFAHRLKRTRITGPGTIAAPETVIANMPGYPSRLAASRDRGFWLSLFALRTHLVEFVLREDDFRREMMRDVAQDHWIAPALSSGNDCLEPLQVGGLRALGIDKPWAPARSYGLAARLDGEGEVVETLHSRVGGKYHGVTAALATAQGVVIVSRGSGRLLLIKTDWSR